MANQRKLIGRLPVFKGEWSSLETYNKLNEVTLYGSSFRSKIDGNTYKPAELNEEGTGMTVNENWYVVANGTDAYLAGEKIASIDGNTSTYNVSRFHQHTGFWEAVEYDELEPAYLEAQEYTAGNRVNLVNYTNHTFVAMKDMTGVMPDYNNISNKFTLEEAILFVPSKYRLTGMNVGFLDSSNKPVVHKHKGGTFTEVSNWEEDVQTQLTELSSLNIFKKSKVYYGVQYMNLVGSVNTDSTGPYVVTDFIPITEGTYIRVRYTKTEGLSDNAALYVTFDSDKTALYTRDLLSGDVGVEKVVEKTLTSSGKNIAYIRFCGPKDSFYIEEIRLPNDTDLTQIEQQVSDLDAVVKGNTASINTLSGSLGDINADIKSSKQLISENTSAISDNTELIRQHESRFGTFETTNNEKLASLEGEQALINAKVSKQKTELQSTKTDLQQQIDSQKAEVDSAKESALSAIEQREAEAIQNFNKERVAPSMLSQETLDLINSSGGGSIVNNADGEDLEVIESQLKFKDRLYSPLNFSGKGYKIIRKNLQEDINLLTSSDLSEENTIYVIRYDFNLNGASITIPSGCVLLFDGGKFTNGTLYLGNSIIKSSLYQIFDNVLVYDSEKSESPVKTDHPLYVEWFGAIGDGETDDTQAINNCAKCSSGVIVFQKRQYYITDMITLSSREIKPNSMTLVSDIVGKFALLINGSSGNEDGYTTVNGGFTLLNKNYSITEIDSQQTFSAKSISYNNVEANNTSSVTYQDFTIEGAFVGDMVLVSPSEEVKNGFCKFSGEVISENTVRIYANNFYFTSFSIEDAQLNIKILHNTCHGLNVSGNIQAYHQIRIVKYTGVSCGMGSGLDIECGIRYPAQSKVYYSHLEINTFAAGGICFSCNGKNNCNSFKIISFSSPYSTTEGWPKTYPYHAVISGGINNNYELLSLEGTYHKEPLVVYGTGNSCLNCYCELVKRDDYPSTNTVVKSYKYAASNTFKFVYSTDFLEPSLIEGPNFIYKVPQAYLNGGMRKQPFTSCNLLQNFSFITGKSKWNDYSTGSNKTFTTVDGPLPNTKAARLYTEGGRIILDQSITLNEVSFKNIPVTISAWVRGACRIYAVSLNTSITNSSDKYSDDWHYVESTLFINDVPTGNKINVQFRSSENYTGYLEVFNPCVTIGNSSPENINAIDKTTINLNSQGILFNSGDAIAPGETYSEDIVLDWVKQESMVNFRWRVPDKIDFLNKFKLEYVISDGFIRLYLTNITNTNQYSGRVYPYIQLI